MTACLFDYRFHNSLLETENPGIEQKKMNMNKYENVESKFL